MQAATTSDGAKPPSLRASSTPLAAALAYGDVWMVCAVGAALPFCVLCVGCVSRVDGVDTDIKPARRERRARPAERAEDLAALARLCESGIFDPPIDSVFALADIAAAHARVDTGRKTGAVVVAIPD